MRCPLHDYQEFLKENGLTNAQMDAANLAAKVDETPCEKLFVAKSGIAGQGAFAAKDIDTNQIISQLKTGDKWTLAGRYVNHSPEPNTAVTIDNELLALKPISKGEELTANYRQVKRAMEANF
jgi:hypothetical protein